MTQLSGSEQSAETSVANPQEQAINHVIDSLAYLVSDDIPAHSFVADIAGDLNVIVSQALTGSSIPVLNNPRVAGGVGQTVENVSRWLAVNDSAHLDASGQGVRDTLVRAGDQYKNTGSISGQDIVNGIGTGVGNSTETLLRELNIPFLSDAIIDWVGSKVSQVTVQLVNETPGLLSQSQSLVNALNTLGTLSTVGSYQVPPVTLSGQALETLSTTL